MKLRNLRSPEADPGRGEYQKYHKNRFNANLQKYGSYHSTRYVEYYKFVSGF